MKKYLLEMLQGLDERKDKDILVEQVGFKLDRELNYYNEELQKKCDYLVRRNALSMLNAINRQKLLVEENEEDD